MRTLVFILIYIIVGISETMCFSHEHSAINGELNLATLEHVENFIHKNIEIEPKRYFNQSFIKNGYSVNTKVVEHRFGANVYIESFYEIQNPENEYRMRLVVNPDGSKELAIFINCDEEFKNYHACFDANGIFIQEDPWGKNKGNYSIEIFDVYKRYLEIYTQKIDAKSNLANK